MTVGSIMICIFLALMVGLIIFSMIRDKKQGKHLGCGGDCSHCHGSCPHSVSSK